MWFKAGCFSLALLVSAGNVTFAQSHARSTQVVKLKRFRQALWTVHLTANGVAGDFLFDTGGGNTLLTKEFAARLKCNFWGRTTGYNMFGKKGEGPHCDGVQLVADGVSFTPVNVGTIDFAGQFEGDKAPDGLLSLDAFDGKAITIDQVAGTLTIETDESLPATTRSMRELPFRTSRECSARCLSVFVGVETKPGMTWLTLDSGAGGVSLISREYATAFNLDPAAKQQRLRYDIAPGITVDSPVIVTDMIMDGNLGQPFMSKYIMTLDLRQSRLWVVPAESVHVTN